MEDNILFILSTKKKKTVSIMFLCGVDFSILIEVQCVLNVYCNGYSYNYLPFLMYKTWLPKKIRNTLPKNFRELTASATITAVTVLQLM